MDEIRVNRIPAIGIVPIGDGGRHRHEHPSQERHPSDEPRKTPDELAFLLRRSKVAGDGLVDTRVELVNEDGNLIVRILDAATGDLIGEMTGEELARLAREAHITTGVLGEWRK